MEFLALLMVLMVQLLSIAPPLLMLLLLQLFLGVAHAMLVY
jgi:hypothetical protein